MPRNITARAAERLRSLRRSAVLGMYTINSAALGAGRPNPAFILTAVLVLAVGAHAQSAGSPFDATVTTIQTDLCGPIARGCTILAIALSGFPMLFGMAGDHKGKLMGVCIGAAIALGAQSIVSWLW